MVEENINELLSNLPCFITYKGNLKVCSNIGDLNSLSRNRNFLRHSAICSDCKINVTRYTGDLKVSATWLMFQG